MRRLGKSGLILKVKRRTAPMELDPNHEDLDLDVDMNPTADADADADVDMDAEENFIDDEEDKDAQSRKRTPKRRNRKQLKVRWTRCVVLMREPTENDRAAFTSQSAAERVVNEDDPDESEPEDEDLDELEAIDETSTVAGPSAVKPFVKQRVPPQWHPGVHHTQFIFNLIDSCGTAGISTMVCLHQELCVNVTNCYRT